MTLETSKQKTIMLDTRGLEPPEPYMKAVEALNSLKSGEKIVFITNSWRCALLFRSTIIREKLEKSLQKS